MSVNELEKSCKNLKFSGAYSGLPAFQKAKSGADAIKVKQALHNIDAYTLHHRVQLKYKRRKTRVFFDNFQIGIDLMSTENVAKHNKGIRFVLVAVDNFSRFAYVSFLKSKTAESVFNGLTYIFRQIKKRKKELPKRILADQGTEFYNKKVLSLLKKNDIHSIFCAL